MAAAGSETSAEREAGLLTEKQRAALIGIGVRKRFGVGETICHEGEDADTLFVIEEGAARVVRYAANGRDAILAFLGPGDVLGEVAALAGLARNATVEAQTELEAHVVRRGDLLALLRHEPELAVGFARLLAVRLSHANALFTSLNALKMRARLAAGLLQLAARHGTAEGRGVRLKLDITQRELGAFVGLSRENVSRVLAEWRQVKLIAFEAGGDILVRDRERLEDLAMDED